MLHLLKRDSGLDVSDSGYPSYEVREQFLISPKIGNDQAQEIVSVASNQIALHNFWAVGDRSLENLLSQIDLLLKSHLNKDA